MCFSSCATGFINSIERSEGVEVPDVCGEEHFENMVKRKSERCEGEIYENKKEREEKVPAIGMRRR